MLAVTRSNLDMICCTCLVNMCFVKGTGQKTYDIKKETNVLEMLKLTAYTDVLKDPSNLKFIHEYCSKICDICFLKIQKAIKFRERLIASTYKLKDLLERESCSDKFKDYCRVCLKRQQVVSNDYKTNNIYLEWIDNFGGMDEVIYELKEYGLLPKQLCQNCLEEVQSIEELQLLSKYSLEHIVSEIEISDNSLQTDSNLSNNITTEDGILTPCECQEKVINNVYLQTNNTDVATTSVSKGNCSTEGLKVYSSNKKAASEISQYDKTPHTPSNLLNEVVVKCEVEDTQCQEINCDSVNLQTNTDLKDLQNAENKITSTYETDYSDEATMDYEKYTNDDFAYSTEPYVVDSNAKEEGNVKQFAKKNEEKSDFGKPALVCPICSKSFKKKYHLNRHVNSVHSKTKAFKCPYCPSTFSRKNSADLHTLIHTEERPFVCQICQRIFRDSSKLKIHLEIHNTSPELLCPICKRAQKTTEELKIHINTHKKKQYPCPNCDKVYCNRSYLDHHQIVVHLKLQPYKCKYCDKTFSRAAWKKNHEKSHNEDDLQSS